MKFDVTIVYVREDGTIEYAKTVHPRGGDQPHPLSFTADSDWFHDIVRRTPGQMYLDNVGSPFDDQLHVVREVGWTKCGEQEVFLLVISAETYG